MFRALQGGTAATAGPGSADELTSATPPHGAVFPCASVGVVAALSGDISELVVTEAGAGDVDAARARLEVVDTIAR